MYLIRTTLYGFNYFLSIFKSKGTEFTVWEGVVQNAKTFDNEESASDFAYAYSTLECEIIKITYE